MVHNQAQIYSTHHSLVSSQATFCSHIRRTRCTGIPGKEFQGRISKLRLNQRTQDWDRKQTITFPILHHKKKEKKSSRLQLQMVQNDHILYQLKVPFRKIIKETMRKQQRTSRARRCSNSSMTNLKPSTNSKTSLKSMTHQASCQKQWRMHRLRIHRIAPICNLIRYLDPILGSKAGWLNCKQMVDNLRRWWQGLQGFRRSRPRGRFRCRTPIVWK